MVHVKAMKKQQIGVRVTTTLRRRLEYLRKNLSEQRGPGREVTLTDLVMELLYDGAERVEASLRESGQTESGGSKT